MSRVGLGAFAAACLVLAVSPAHAEDAASEVGAPPPEPRSPGSDARAPRTADDGRSGWWLPGRTHVGAETKFTTLSRAGALLLGGQGGWTFDRRWVVALGGYGLVEAPDQKIQTGPSTRLSTVQLTYGGARLAYVIRPADVLHLTVGAMAAAGSVQTVRREGLGDAMMARASSAFFAFEPGVELEAGFLPWLRVSATATYRYVVGARIAGLSSSDLSGPGAGLGMKIGRF